MARRNRQQERPDASTSERAIPGDEASTSNFVVARVGDEALGFRLEGVSEIIRLPALAIVPLAPKSLLGLANLRGVVLPVVSLRGLLGMPEAPFGDAVRIIVMGAGVPVGFSVDGVETLLSIASSRVSTNRAGAGRLDPDVLDGVVQGGEGATTIKIINPDRLLHGQFDRIGVSAAPATAGIPIAANVQASAVAQRPLTSLVSFDLGTQEYALPLDRVREIVAVPPDVSEIAGSQTAVLGVVTLRGRLLPLVSLRALLGLRPRPDGEARGKVIVVSMGNGSVGVVADRTREILRIDPAFIDAAPALLTRGAGEAEVESICRLDGGKRLVAVLSPDHLFRSELVRRVLSEAGNDNAEEMAAERDMTDEQFIIFRLGAQDYGLPIAAVAEITRAPDRITRMPKAPVFIDGVINLRGLVLPIVDLRRRFDLASDAPAGAGRRILVLAVGNARAGFIVDAVSEVLKVAAQDIQPAPELSPEQMRLIGRIANLKAPSRIILLVDPAQLLTESEASAVATLSKAATAQPLTAS